MEIKAALSGLFKVEVIRPDGTVETCADWFRNLITDSGLDRLGSGGNPWTTCRVGTGNTPPAVTDTQPAAQRSATTNKTLTTNGINSAEGYSWERYTWTFAQGAVTGNIAELCVGWASSGAGIFSRALIKDSSGNPTTIPIASNEILRVTWEVRVAWPTVDLTGTQVFTGNKGGTYNWTSRARLVGTSPNWTIANAAAVVALQANYVNYGGALGPITGEPTYTARDSVSSFLTPGAYVPASFKATGVLSLDLAYGNSAAGIKSITFTTTMLNCAFQMAFDPPIPKTAEDFLSLPLSVSWGRAA